MATLRPIKIGTVILCPANIVLVEMGNRAAVYTVHAQPNLGLAEIVIEGDGVAHLAAFLDRHPERFVRFDGHSSKDHRRWIGLDHITHVQLPLWPDVDPTESHYVGRDHTGHAYLHNTLAVSLLEPEVATLLAALRPFDPADLETA